MYNCFLVAGIGVCLQMIDERNNQLISDLIAALKASIEAYAIDSQPIKAKKNIVHYLQF